MSKNYITPGGFKRCSLFKARAGDVVTFQSPKGPREIEIVEVRYEVIE